MAWDWSISPEIALVMGPSLEHARLTLVAGCSSAPSAAGFPIAAEFKRSTASWSRVAARDNLLHGARTYAPEPLTFEARGRSYRLFLAEDPTSWGDGFVADRDLESLKHCLGTARILDDVGTTVSEPRVPRDLCLLGVHGQGERLTFVGWGPSGKLTVEVRDGKRTQRSSPVLPPDSRLWRARGEVHWLSAEEFDFRGELMANVPPGEELPEIQRSYVAHFDGAAWQEVPSAGAGTEPPAARPPEDLKAPYAIAEGVLFERHEGQWRPVPFPPLSADLEADFQEPQRAEELLLSQGTYWVLASAGRASCLTYQGDNPRLLYSLSPGPVMEEPTQYRRELRPLQGPDCFGSGRVALLAKGEQPLAFDEVSAPRLALEHRVPDVCGLALLTTSGLSALGVTSTGDARCKAFTQRWRGESWCLPNEALTPDADMPLPSEWTVTFLRAPEGDSE